MSLHAARLLLETSGDLRSSAGGVNVSINNNMSAGYVIDLTEEKQAKVIEHADDANAPLTRDAG